MKTSTIGKTIGLLALLGSSASMAASVWVTASTLTPNVGENFTMTITADIPNTFAGTMDLAFDATKVAFVQTGTGVLAGVGTTPWLFIKNSPATETPTPINVEQPSTTGPNPGVYQIAVMTFTALAGGAANITLSDDLGVTSGWFDDTLFEYIPLSGGYNNANVIVQGAVVPAPATLGLLATGLAGLAFRARRKRAA